MASQWFVQRDGKQNGPVASEQLLAMWLSGRLTPHDLIRRHDSKHWVAAGSVPGLLPPTAVADASTVVPVAQRTKRKKSYLPRRTTVAALFGAALVVYQLARLAHLQLGKEPPDAAETAVDVHNVEQAPAKQGKAPALVPELEALCADAEEVFILDPSRRGFAKPQNGDVFGSFPDASLPTAEEKPSPRRQILVVLKTGSLGKLFVQTDGMGIIDLADLKLAQDDVGSDKAPAIKTPLVFFGSKAHGPPDSLVTRSYRLVLHTNNDELSCIDDWVQNRFKDQNNGMWSKSDWLSRWEGPLFIHKQRVPANGQAEAGGSGLARRADQAVSPTTIAAPEGLQAESHTSPSVLPEKSGVSSHGVSPPEMARTGNAVRLSAPQTSERTGSGEIGGVVESGNVARASNGTKVSKIWANQTALLDGVYEGEPAHDGIGKSWTVTFAKTYSLSRIRLKLWDRPNRFYTYKIEASEDGINFRPLIDRSTGAHKGWQELDFPAKPIRALRVTGLSDTKKVGFHVHELEAYCTP